MTAPDFLRVAAVRTLGDPLLTTAEAKVLLALHEAHPSRLSHHQISDAVEAHRRSKVSGIVKVWICNARSKTFSAAIESEQHHGYRLSDEMHARMQALFAGRLAA